jgi:hypothetical protein
MLLRPVILNAPRFNLSSCAGVLAPRTAHGSVIVAMFGGCCRRGIFIRGPLSRAPLATSLRHFRFIEHGGLRVV